MMTDRRLTETMSIALTIIGTLAGLSVVLFGSTKMDETTRGTIIIGAVAVGAVATSPYWSELGEPDYQIGPRGGRYTVEDSKDGGTYRRYR